MAAVVSTNSYPRRRRLDAVTGLHGLDRPRRREARVALAACLVAFAGYAFIALHGAIGSTIQIEHIDLNVYRAGARAVLDGADLYGTLPAAAPGIDLPFTYPPIAALLLTPLAVLPSALDALIALSTTVLLLGYVQRTVLRTIGRPSGAMLNWSMLIAMPAALILDPVRIALADGQIDVLLMALVVADTLGSGIRIGGRQHRGVLVGLAAAVKLTPAVFVLYYLVRGDRRAAATSAASFAAFTGLGALMAPRDSSEYWLHAVFQTDRIGAIWYAANQSLEAVLARFGLTGHALSLCWLLGCVLVIALARITMRRAAAFGTPVGVLLLNALAELLISPISWTHHWVWIAPTVVALGASAQHGAPRHIRHLAVIAFAAFALGPQWLLPHGGNRELRWALWEQILGGTYVWFGLTVLVAVAFTRRPSPVPNRRCPHTPPHKTKALATIPARCAGDDEPLAADGLATLATGLARGKTVVRVGD